MCNLLRRGDHVTIQDELTLSYYKTVADINVAHNIHLVQDTRNGKFFVKKMLAIYNLDVYKHLMVHPIRNTPTIYAIVEDDGRLITIEEYIPGDTLEEVLAKGSLTEDQSIGITISLCQIIEQFHNCTPPIVNRDIKPPNIKITPDGVVKLVDLNAAKPCSAEATRDTVLLGTQGYAAPEQYGFGASSVLTDIYAIGVLMNEMLTGELPGTNLANGKLRHVISRCVELTPKNRFQSVRQLRETLMALQGMPVPQEPVLGWQKFLPPGFRTAKPIRWILSAIGYIFLFYFGATLIVENATAASLLANRIFFTIAALGIVFFSGNYLDVHKHLPLTKSKNKLVRLLGTVLYDTIIFSGIVLILVILESAVF